MAFIITFKPSEIRLICDAPLVVAEAAVRAGVDLRVDCGRKGKCGKCRVRLEGDYLPQPTESEKRFLSSRELAEGWRLACRAMVDSEVGVHVPDPTASRKTPTKTLDNLDGLGNDPATRAFALELSPPSLEDQAADLDRVVAQLAERFGMEFKSIDLPTLSELRQSLRQGNWRVSLALNRGEIVGAQPGLEAPCLGLAVDVGTTKIACHLVDLNQGRVMGVAEAMNPQIAYGGDVMCRLEAASHADNKQRMQEMVVNTINHLTENLCAAHDLTPARVHDACLAGNTAMHHLLLGLPVKPLGVAPFVSATGLALHPAAREIGLNLSPGARMYLPPPIAGFVGSDHVAFLTAAGFGAGGGVRLGIDIGTNTEIALEKDGRIACCSAASGPAFEGAHLSHGMRAEVGAVEHLKIRDHGQVTCQVVGDAPPVGICGTGILDAIAEMHQAGIINRRGHLQAEAPGVFPQSDGSRSFKLAGAEPGGQEVIITQNDISQALLAKGAIRAGIDLLMEQQGVATGEIDEVLIAGAFGTCLDSGNAVRIGMLPQVSTDRVKVVGNAAGAGVCLMLASQEARRHAEKLARGVSYLELTVHPKFTLFFVEGMRLPGPPV